MTALVECQRYTGTGTYLSWKMTVCLESQCPSQVESALMLALCFLGISHAEGVPRQIKLFEVIIVHITPLVRRHTQPPCGTPQHYIQRNCG